MATKEHIELTDKIMRRMGLDPHDMNRHVSDLRVAVMRKVERGALDWHVSWAPGDHTPEERAIAMLEAEWEIEHRHERRVDPFFIDGGLIRCRFNTLTMRSHYEFHHEMIGAWFRDRLGAFAMQWRILRDRYVLRLRNPYSH